MIEKTDLTNKTFNSLLVLRLDPDKTKQKGRAWWMCQCVCDKIVSRRADYLMSGKAKSCGCQHPRLGMGDKHHSFSGCNDITGSHWSHIKYSAKHRDLEFNITIEYIWDLFIQQNKKCKLSGLNIELYSDRKIKNTASLDRIDSNKGYIKGNVQWVHKRVNRMKMELDQTEFIELCKSIAQHNT